MSERIYCKLLTLLQKIKENPLQKNWCYIKQLQMARFNIQSALKLHSSYDQVTLCKLGNINVNGGELDLNCLLGGCIY